MLDVMVNKTMRLGKKIKTMFATHKTAIDYSRFLAVDIICMHVYSELIVNFKTQDINCAHGAKNSLYAGLRISPLVHI